MLLKKGKVTLIGSVLAKADLEFVYEGPAEECESCKMRKVCHNLQPGKKYRITEVRTGTKHECPVHLDSVSAVEVVEASIVALIGSDMAIVNSKMQYEFPCTRTGCGSFPLCHPDGIVEGEKYVVGEVLGSAPEPCERGRSLKRVELRPA